MKTLDQSNMMPHVVAVRFYVVQVGQRTRRRAVVGLLPREGISCHHRATYPTEDASTVTTVGERSGVHRLPLDYEGVRKEL